MLARFTYLTKKPSLLLPTNSKDISKGRLYSLPFLKHNFTFFGNFSILFSYKFEEEVAIVDLNVRFTPERKWQNDFKPGIADFNR